MEPAVSPEAAHGKACRALLAQRPEALVAAIGSDGLFVPMPAGVPLTDHREIHARSALDIVAPGYRTAVIDAWDRARADGIGRTRVELADSPGRAVLMHLFDTRSDYGCFMGVIVADGGIDAEVGVRAAPEIPPRLGRIHKNETAIILSVDDAASRMLGMTAEVMVGQRSLDFIHPDDHERAIESWMQMLGAPQTGHRVRLRHRCGDGGWKWVEVTNFNQLEGEGGQVVAEVLDISDEMAAHEALRAREQLLRRLTSALPTGVLQVDVDGSVLYANERLRHILGVTGATVREQFSSLRPSDRERLGLALAEVLGDGVDRDLEIVAELPSSGVKRSCLVNVRALTAADGAVSGAIVCVNDVTESSRLRDELERQASIDTLTGCRNRRATMADLTRALATATDLAVIFLDLDDFKSVNDRFGHAAGDELLSAVGSRLRRTVRSQDAVGRIGGDEFLVLCPDIGSEAEARRLGARLAEAVSDPVGLSSEVVLIPSASVGLAWTGDSTPTADALVAQADADMYRTKRGGPRLRLAPDRRRRDRPDEP